VYYEILDFHGGDYEQYCLLGLDMQFGGCVPIMQRNHLPSFSAYKGPEGGRNRSYCTLVPVYQNAEA
jgi:hypothetical protein